MLRRRNLARPLAAVLIEHECPRCHCEVELPLGELCGACRNQIERRAAKTARLVAGVSTLAVALYVFIPPPPGEQGRVVGAVGVVVWYVLISLIVRRMMQNWER
jgi:hypothetical protein